MTKSPAVKIAFERESRRLAIADIIPLHIVGTNVRQSLKFAQIAASIREVGIIEPPVVIADDANRGKYLLLDGHLRIEVLKDLKVEDVVA